MSGFGANVETPYIADSLFVSPDSTSAPAATPPDSTISDKEDEKRHSPVKWIYQLMANGFHINDPNIDYPRFPRFCRDVYNWGDKVFNSYDTTYVVSTGKNWKAQAKSFNWMQSYTFLFPHRQQLHINSDIYADIGGHVSFMALSIGYMFNANELLAHNHNKRSYFNLNFTCALFTIDYTTQSIEGGARITHAGNISDDNNISLAFDGLNSNETSFMAYYMFNHRRYSHAAAYCYSKYQLRGAGSWIAGFNYYKQNTSMDFTALGDEIFKPLPELQTQYHFHHTDYMAVGGYGHNWVPKPRRWLINLTSLLGLGYKHSQEDSSDKIRDMVALQARLSGAVVYNHRKLFAALTIKAWVPFYFNNSYTMINTFASAEATVGFRF